MQTKRVEAGPVKRFFIDIITRDIDLNAAILDLVDNSVDSALSLRPGGDFTGLEIQVEAKVDYFSISDNCAGIPTAAATDYVFRLGRPDDTEGLSGSIGQFGVGMKRALFKLGNRFQVESHTQTSHFSLDLDVVEWEKTPDWWFELDVHDDQTAGEHPTGTVVAVDTLHKAVSDSFSRPDIISSLREDLRSKHRHAIENGLSVLLNGRQLTTIPSQLAVGDAIQPLVQEFTVERPDGSNVHVTLYAGVSAEGATDEDSAPEDAKLADQRAGWNVFGNNRLLLAADRSHLTGWGGSGNMPLYHNQYSRFRGYLFMSSSDTEAIPWNTMKTGVDGADPAWLAVRGAMISAGKQVVGLLNALKKERVSENKDLDTPISNALATSRPVTVSRLLSDGETALKYPAPNPQFDTRTSVKRITYTVPKTDYDEVCEALGEETAARVGRATFDYFYEKQVGEA